ncbi:MAG: hypothetical protein ACUVQ3_10135 [bacterium]
MRRTRKTKSIKKGSRRVDELLLSALGSELMAIDFYQKAAEKAQSQAGKKFFTEMGRI